MISQIVKQKDFEQSMLSAISDDQKVTNFIQCQQTIVKNMTKIY